MATNYMYYFKEGNFGTSERNIGASSQFDKVNPGDIVWAVTKTSDGSFMLAQRIDVVWRGNVEDAIQRGIEKEAIWGNEWTVIEGTKPRIRQRDWISLDPIAWDLRFNSAADRLNPDANNQVNPQQLRTMRELTDETAQILEQLLGDEPSAGIQIPKLLKVAVALFIVRRVIRFISRKR